MSEQPTIQLTMSAQGIGELVAALSEVDFPPITKDSKNPHLGSKFADLTTLINACRVPLAKHGLVVIQTNGVLGTDGVVIHTTLAHKSGQWISGALYLSAKPAKGLSDEQVVGKAITYGRRYGYQAILSLSAEDDDDGHIQRDERAQRQPPPQQRAPAQAPAPRARDPRPYEERMRLAVNYPELRAIGGEIERDAQVSPAERDRLKAVFLDQKAKLAAPRRPDAPPSGGGDDLGGRM